MPKVFISYSHDSEEHVRRVRQLADRLRQDNVDTVLDQYEPAPPEGWPHWMDRQLDEADFVLIVCTPRYAEKAKEPHRSGVRFEGVLILQELYDSGMWNERFIPILYSDADPRSIIRPLRAYTRYQIDTEEGYELLLRRLTADSTPLKSQVTSKSSPPFEEAHSGLTSIPKLPPNYLPRNEYLAALRNALLATDTRSLGITGEGTVGLLGMGGIGKSVLAAAVARDSAIREAFGDRIYWLVLGQEPNLAYRKLHNHQKREDLRHKVK